MLSNFLTFALEIRADGTYTPFSAEAWSYAGQMTLLGMLMIFAVLAILWGVLAIFKLVFAGKSPKKKEPAPAPEKAAESAQSVQTATEPQSDDAELVAIITAAVAAYRASEGESVSDGSFRVVSFKRVGRRAWNSK